MKSHIDGPFKTNPKIAGRRMGAETVLLNLETNIYYSLNETGSLVWELIGSGLHVPAIVSRIAAEYEVGAKTALDDVSSLVEDLLAEGFLEKN